MDETSETQNKDGPIAITEKECELAQEALSEFQKGAYASSLVYLNNLETHRPKDLKVMHNKVVVEFYKNGLKKTELLRKSLNAICGQVFTNSIPTINNIEKCVMRYNQAVLLYHMKQYSAALQIMHELLPFIEPMEESLSHKISLLLIELNIAMEQPDAALSLINYIESQLLSTDNPKISVDKEGIMKSIKEQKEQKEPKKEVDTATDAFKIKLLKCKARIYLMTHHLKLCKKECKTLVSSGTPVNISTVFLKANLEYLRGNHNKAIKLLNSAKSENLDFKTCGESLAVLYYNNMACIHLAMGKPNLACYYIREAIKENKRALDSVQSQDSDSLLLQPLYTLGGNRLHYELMYSLGVSLLQTGEASVAFDCFMEAAKKLHNDPKLWLNIAECCIYTHRPTNEVDFHIPKRRKDIIKKIISTGTNRKIILASSLSKNVKYPGDFSSETPQLTLKFASLCLKNALFLLQSNNEFNASLTVPQTMPLSLAAGHNLSAQYSPFTVQATNEALNLKISILAASAYVCLCIGDYVIALEHAKALLDIDQLPGAYRMLGNLYAAESLILMDKISEAIEYLKLENIQDLNTWVPIPETQDKEKEKSEEVISNPIKMWWYPTTIPTGIAVLRYNLAVAYAIRGELENSEEILKGVWESKKSSDCAIPVHVIMLAIYIQLKLGHTDVSRMLIKQHCLQ